MLIDQMEQDGPLNADVPRHEEWTPQAFDYWNGVTCERRRACVETCRARTKGELGIHRPYGDWKLVHLASGETLTRAELDAPLMALADRIAPLVRPDGVELGRVWRHIRWFQKNYDRIVADALRDIPTHQFRVGVRQVRTNEAVVEVRGVEDPVEALAVARKHVEERRASWWLKDADEETEIMGIEPVEGGWEKPHSVDSTHNEYSNLGRRDD